MNGSSLQAERVTASAKAARMVVVFIAVVVGEMKKGSPGGFREKRGAKGSGMNLVRSGRSLPFFLNSRALALRPGFFLQFFGLSENRSQTCLPARLDTSRLGRQENLQGGSSPLGAILNPIDLLA